MAELRDQIVQDSDNHGHDWESLTGTLLQPSVARS